MFFYIYLINTKNSNKFQIIPHELFILLTNNFFKQFLISFISRSLYIYFVCYLGHKLAIDIYLFNFFSAAIHNFSNGKVAPDFWLSKQTKSCI